jgi:hypothetical protein
MRTLYFILIAFVAPCVITSRTLAAAAAVQECDVNSLPATVEQLQNPDQEPIAFLFAKGVRVFNCSTGSPSIVSGGLVNVTDGGLLGPAGAESKWTGVGYYPDSDGNGTFALTEIDSKTGAPVGAEFFIILDYGTPVQFVPAPDGKSLDWALWNVFTAPKALQEELGIGWGSRVDTEGGEEPIDCSNIFVNNSVVVEYTAIYYFYPCPSTVDISDSNTNSNFNSPSPEQAVQETNAASIASAAAPLLFNVVLSVAVFAAEKFILI